MSEFVPPAAPISRLFFRIDLAAQPQSLALRHVLDRWQSERGAGVYPSRDRLGPASLGPERAHVFAFDAVAGDDFVLRFGGEALDQLLGAMAPGDRLSLVEARRSAARLRHLFHLIELRGEPVVAGFEARRADGAAVDVEALIAPISADHATVDTLVGALDLRETPGALLPRDED